MLDERDPVRLTRENVPVAIRDLAENNPPPGVWLPAINVATGGPQSHVIYHDLVKHAQMRLKRTAEGHAMVTVSEAGSVHLLKVPSAEFVRFVDRFRVGRRLRVLPEASLNELSRIIEARVGDPRFADDPSPSPHDEMVVDPPVAPPNRDDANEVETDLMAYALNRLVFSSPYVFVPSALAAALGGSEKQITTLFVENRDRLRELGFESRSVVSSVGPVFLVTRVRPGTPQVGPGHQEPRRD
jgi:hypothetical protein